MPMPPSEELEVLRLRIGVVLSMVPPSHVQVDAVMGWLKTLDQCARLAQVNLMLLEHIEQTRGEVYNEAKDLLGAALDHIRGQVSAAEQVLLEDED